MRLMTVEATLENIRPVTDFVNEQLQALECTQHIRVQMDDISYAYQNGRNILTIRKKI